MTEAKLELLGDAMDAWKFLELADEYANAADTLRKLHRVSKPQSLAPFRFAALHAVELYLSAFLRLHGHESAEIRKSGHRYCDKAQAAGLHGLVLRKRTLKHLHDATEAREYLVTRYDAPGLAGTSPLSRLEATLSEVKRKVSGPIRATKNPGVSAGAATLAK